VPAVLALHGRFEARGLRVAGISNFDPTDAESERQGAIEASREEKMNYPTYLDENNAWSKKHAVTDIPAFLVLGRDGRVIFRHRGKLVVDSPAYVEMAKAIEKAL
jgi:hypothetical protein